MTYQYDLAGRLLSASTPVVTGNPASGAWEWGYDTAGRLTSEEAPDGKTVSYELDENSNIGRINYPDGYYVQRFYDELNRLTDIKLNGSMSAVAHFDYDDLSRRTALIFDNGVQTDYTYEWNDDVSSIEHAFSGSDLDFAYGFNDAHQLISQTISDAQHMWHPTIAGSTEFGDANKLNQLPYSTGSCGRLFKGYNANGCLSDDGVFRYEYDAENHLISAADGTTSVDYVYNPMHRQTQKNVDGTKTRYVHSGWQRLADYNGNSDTLQKRYVYGVGLDEPLVTVSSGGALTYLHADRLGSIVALSDNTGAVTNRYAYSPWGECGDLSGTSFGFTGQTIDLDTNLYNFKRRYYSAELARFLQPDPLGRRSGLNLLFYVKNDPLNSTDPFGMQGMTGTAMSYGARMGFSTEVGGPVGLGIAIFAMIGEITWGQFQILLHKWEELHELEEKYADQEYSNCMKKADKDFDDKKDKLLKKFRKCKNPSKTDKDNFDEELKELKKARDQEREFCRDTREAFPFTPKPDITQWTLLPDWADPTYTDEE